MVNIWTPDHPKFHKYIKLSLKQRREEGTVGSFLLTEMPVCVLFASGKVLSNDTAISRHKADRQNDRPRGATTPGWYTNIFILLITLMILFDF